jgi:hypothetical protein
VLAANTRSAPRLSAQLTIAPKWMRRRSLDHLSASVHPPIR